MDLQPTKKNVGSMSIAILCFGYFACYIPYSMMTKMLTKGLFPSMGGSGFSGFEIQPMVVLSSFTCMFAFITIMGWWKHTTHFKLFGLSISRPRWYTFISGLCTGGQIITTTLAYTFNGVSIVFAMLLMRGGVLVMAPVVDTIARRRKRKILWPSWVAAGLSFLALLAAFLSKAGTAMTIICAIDISLYLFVYFFRLFFMSTRAKSDDQNEKKAYFAEEQMVANVVLFLALIVVAVIGSTMEPTTIPAKIYAGFTQFPSKGYLVHALLIGLFSYGVGTFGSLIYLDKRENTFCVPANRASSIVAGVVATYLLHFLFGQRTLLTGELVGVILIIFAIFFLYKRTTIEKKKQKKQRK